MLLDHAAWLAANLGLLGPPTARAHSADMDKSAPAAATAAASFKQRVTNAIAWALAVHARDTVISTGEGHSSCKALPWLATLPLSTSSSASSGAARGGSGCVPVTNPLEWWISVERGDGSLRFLYLRPRALPQPSRHVRRPHHAAAIPIQTPIPSSPSRNTNRLQMSHPATPHHESTMPYPIRDPSFVSAREPTVCDSAVEASIDTSACATSSSSRSLASIPSRGRTNDDSFAEWFRNRSSGSSSTATECSHTATIQSKVTLDEFDMVFDDDDDTSSGGSWLDSVPACACGNDDCASLDGDESFLQSDSIPSSPPPIHLSTGRLGFQGSPHYVPLRIDTPPTAVFGYQTPSAPPTPTSAFGTCTCSSSASILFDQAALSADLSTPSTSTPSPPLTPKFNVITLARPDSPPLTCPLPLPEAAVSDFACAADESCRSLSVSSAPLSIGAENAAGWSLGHGGSTSAIPALSAGSVLFA